MSDFKETCLQRYMDVCNDDKPTAGLSYLFASVLYDKIEREQKKNEKIFWLTINPKPDVDFDTFREVVERYINRVFVKNCMYAFEVRGQDQLGYHGFHVHMVFDKPHMMSKKQLLTRTYNTFKDIVGNIMHIDVRLYSGSCREDKEAYLKGEKWDEEKDESVRHTRDWRKLIDLDEYYIKV